MNFLTPAEVCALHDGLAAKHGGNPQPPRDHLLLEMVCARPQMVGYGDLHASVAVLVEGLVNSQPFNAHNTATAFAAMSAMLALNGQKLACGSTTALRAWNEWTHSVDWENVAAWLRLVAEPL